MRKIKKTKIQRWLVVWSGPREDYLIGEDFNKCFNEFIHPIVKDMPAFSNPRGWDWVLGPRYGDTSIVQIYTYYPTTRKSFPSAQFTIKYLT